jgi:hypothetical protein
VVDTKRLRDLAAALKISKELQRLLEGLVDPGTEKKLAVERERLELEKKKDFGYSKPFSIGWWAQDHDGRLYRILELYGCTGEPNTGVKWTPEKTAERIGK